MDPKLTCGGECQKYLQIAAKACASLTKTCTVTYPFIPSIGCIFGELITKEAMIQGQGELDQTDKIFRLVGAPTEENWPGFSKLPNTSIFRWKKGKEKPLLPLKYPVNSPSGGQSFLDNNGFDLLSKLLTLDPERRISAEEALRHAYFHEGVPRQTPHFFFDNT